MPTGVYKRNKSKWDRFWEKVFINPNGCWEWVANNNGKGYGLFWNGERKVLSHRYSYELFIGAIPDGMELDHLCRNKPCVNPYHLEPVTSSENKLRGIWKKKTHCPQGHEYIPENIYRDYRGNQCCRLCRNYRARIWKRQKRLQKKIMSTHHGRGDIRLRR